MYINRHEGYHINKQKVGLLLEMGPFNRLRVSAIKNNKKLSPFSGDIPSDIRHITKRAVSYDHIEDLLILFFQNNDEDTHCFIEINGKLESFTWDSTFNVTSKTYYEIIESIAIIHRVAKENKKKSSTYVRLGSHFILDFSKMRMGVITSTEGWKPWEILLNQVDDFDTFKEVHATDIGYYQDRNLDPLNYEIHLGLKEFNRFLLELGADTKKHILLKSKATVEYKSIFPNDYSLFIQVGKFVNSFEIVLSVAFEGIPVGYDASYFKWFFQAKELMKRPHYIQYRDWLIAQIKSWIIEGTSPTILEKLTKEMTADTEFNSEEIDEISSLYHHFREITSSDHDRHVFFNDQHYLVKSDYKKEGLIYVILWSIFPDVLWHINDELKITIHKRILHENLSQFQDALNDIKVTLNWEQLPIETVHLSFDLTIKETKSWFELHPKIYSNDTLLDKTFLQELIKNQGIIKHDDKIQMLDPKSLVLLENYVETFSDVNKSPVSKKSYFQLNRLQIFDILALKKCGATVHLPKKYDYYWIVLSELSKIPDQVTPKKLKGSLRHYQQDGLNWLSFLYKCGFGACLADDMGLGKTVQTLSFLACLYEGLIDTKIPMVKGPFLVVVPPSLKFVWQSEIEKFYPSFTYLDFLKEHMDENFKDYDIIITTYDMIRRHINLFKEQSFSVGIFDEAQMIKNLFSGRTTAARQLNIGYKVCLTGTPIENHLGEFFSIMDFVVPGLLKSYRSFQKYISSQSQSNDYSKLIERTHPFILRRTKKDILKELPEKTEQNIYLEMSKKQKSLYTKIIKSVRKKVDEAFEKKPNSQATMIALTAILRLRQLCISPKLIEPSYTDKAPKLLYLMEQLQELYDEGHSAIIFSQFRTYIVYMEQILKEAGFPILKMDGRTPQKKRNELIKTFQEEKTPHFFIISLKTGGVGLNLTKASYVYHSDPWWNPAVEDQASSRVHRIGQTQKVFISKLIMRHTIEEKICQLKLKKQQLIDALLNHKMSDKRGGKLTKKDFDFLLSDDELNDI